MDLADLVRRYNDAWNRQDVDAICAMHAPDFVFENHTAGDCRDSGLVRPLP